MNTSHSRPPEKSRTWSDVGSKAKLNSTRITMENATEAFSASLVRNSLRRSLAAMVRTCLTNSAMPRPFAFSTAFDAARDSEACTVS